MMKAALKWIFGEKAYSRLSNHEQRTEYPTIWEEKNEFYVAQKKSKYRNTKLNPSTSNGKHRGVQFAMQKYNKKDNQKLKHGGIELK